LGEARPRSNHHQLQTTNRPLVLRRIDKSPLERTIAPIAEVSLVKETQFKSVSVPLE
jgi:hypothetical protein